MVERTFVKKSIRLVSKYLDEQYGDGTIACDLSRIVLYEGTATDEDLEFVVTLDLWHRTIRQFVDGVCYKVIDYKNLAELKELLDYNIVAMIDEVALEDAFGLKHGYYAALADRNRKVWDIAERLNAFAMDFDPYDYADQVSSEDRAVTKLHNQILKGAEELNGILNHLYSIVEEDGEFAEEASELYEELKPYEQSFYDYTFGGVRF